ncbi:hypothetical protein [Polaromonas sp.]|uniref:hypothetical protein n=1 Tax=Polaromonas sp. TaxID=1869339 RepID=UPI003266BDFA
MTARGACLAVLLTVSALQLASAAGEASPPASVAHKRASFGQQQVSSEVSGLAAWILHSADNQGMPFMIVDKVNAQVLVLDKDGQLKGVAPALLGLAPGDDSTPGIGERKLSNILAHERTTPAGRFVASLDRNLHGVEILWIDYATSISLHKVVKGTPREQRAQRLSSATAADNRISYGCINVPVSFFDKVVSPAFTGTNGIVYILPETRTAREIFGSYDVDEAAQALAPATPAPAPAAASRGQRAVQ